MRKALSLGFALVFVAGAASAQADNDGWRRAGSALGASSEEAYRRGAEQAALLAAARAKVDSAAAAERLAVQEQRWRKSLQKTWTSYGLPAEEAAAVAAAFEIRPEQVAINARVRREGWKVGANDGIAAYKAYNYLLANQLFVATELAMQDEAERVTKQAADELAAEADAKASQDKRAK